MTSRNDGAKSPGRGPGRRFQPGNAGKPPGTRARVTLAVEALLEGEAEALTRKAVERALEGDVTALRLCLERIAPAAKERAIAFRLPPISGPADVPSALGALMQAVAKGDLVPGEAATLAGIVDRWRAAYETTEMDRRLSALEEKAGE